MDLTPYIDNLRHELGVAAAAGGDAARELAERLTAPLESATRLALLDALSAAVDEITRDLAPGSVSLRLRGRDPDFVVTAPPAEAPFSDAEDVADDEPATPAPAVETAEDGSTSRINFRLPEQLKQRVEEAAAAEHLSVNAWLVRSVAATLDRPAGRREPRPAPRGKAGYTGWVR